MRSLSVFKILITGFLAIPIHYDSHLHEQNKNKSLFRLVTSMKTQFNISHDLVTPKNTLANTKRKSQIPILKQKSGRNASNNVKFLIHVSYIRIYHAFFCENIKS